ncbi:type I-F CRISPR-associated protein Csy1 [Gibbsiella quercinecans]|nr:type I-F CRISPR-associated protein Csy1 [Gibbsiella quercinecans]
MVSIFFRTLVAEKKFANDALALAAERQGINDRYQVRAWLTDAASRAEQISLVTHALKFTHSDAKGSSVFSAAPVEESPEYLSTASLRQPAVDAVGNAAALDVAKLLQTEYGGDSLAAALQREDHAALAVLTDDPQQLTQWITGFKRALTDKQLSSHKLAKQIYFPLSDTAAGSQYHLLSPLYSSSLAQALHQRITVARFSDEAKAIRQARKEQRWHDAIDVSYPNLAVQNMGGTKPQNISFLNSGRRGKSYLLPCAAPVWQSIAKPPLQHKSIFAPAVSLNIMPVRQCARCNNFCSVSHRPATRWKCAGNAGHMPTALLIVCLTMRRQYRIWTPVGARMNAAS